MNRKKIVSAMLIVTLTCGLGLTACGGAQGSVSGTEEAEVQRYAWPLGSSSPEDTVTQIYAEKFAEEVERLSGGSMKISVYPNSVLGGDRELLESCKDGDIPFVVQNTAPQVTFMKDTAVFDMPALFETIDEVREHVDNPEFMELMQQVYRDGGYELLGYADQGFRVMTTNKKVENLSDFKGQKIRTMENSYQSPDNREFAKNHNAMQLKTGKMQGGCRWELIKVGTTDVETVGIDTPEDLQRAEDFLKNRK